MRNRKPTKSQITKFLGRRNANEAERGLFLDALQRTRRTTKHDDVQKLMRAAWRATF